MAQDLKDTLLLPKTEFPMRANLVQREPARLAHWEKIGLYDRLQQKRAGRTGCSCFMTVRRSPTATCTSARP
jgi:isoleucyl-tRNA synthetase